MVSSPFRDFLRTVANTAMIAVLKRFITWVPPCEVLGGLPPARSTGRHDPSALGFLRMRTLLPVSARPPRIHRASCDKGGKNEVTKCNLGGDWPQLHLPGLLVLELRQIGAERAGADAAREVLGQLRIIAPDALDAGADVFGYQRTGPLDVRGASTHAAIPPDTRGKLVAERLELALRALFGAGIVISLGLRELRAHFRQPAPIRRYGLRVECFTSVTKIGSSH